MTVGEWLAQTTRTLAEAGIASARLDALLLLSDELDKDKSWLLAYSEHKLQGSELKSLSTKVIQRSKHLPLAYVRGTVEFYGREFSVNKNVLVPRPESEAIITVLKNTILPEEHVTIADIGTGCGALAICAKLERPNTNVIAVDIDAACLAVARQNAAALGTDITILGGDLLAPLQPADNDPLILLCNLPYVPVGYPVNEAAAHEPELALYSGTDGLDHYRRLFTDAEHLLPRFIITESLPQQHNALQEIAAGSGYQLRSKTGLVQLYALAEVR